MLEKLSIRQRTVPCLLIIAVTIFLSLATIILTVLFKSSVPSEPYLFLPGLTARKKDSVYIVSISQNGRNDKTICFSDAREILKVKGIEPIKINDPQALIGMEMKSIIEQFGEPHCDVGSGFYIPAYITPNAYLISFDLTSEDVVFRIEITDLINGQEVGEISTGQGGRFSVLRLGTRGRFSCLLIQR